MFNGWHVQKWYVFFIDLLLSIFSLWLTLVFFFYWNRYLSRFFYIRFHSFLFTNVRIHNLQFRFVFCLLNSGSCWIDWWRMWWWGLILTDYNSVNRRKNIDFFIRFDKQKKTFNFHYFIWIIEWWWLRARFFP